MWPDIGMVQMYSKSPCSYVFLPGSLLCPSETHCTIHLPLFLEETYLHSRMQDDYGVELEVTALCSCAVIMRACHMQNWPP